MKRKHKGYRQPITYVLGTLYLDERPNADGSTMGTQITMSYYDEKFHLTKINWGTDMGYERSRSGEVESNWQFDEENTQKLMLRLGAHNGHEMLAAIVKRFKKKGSSATSAIREFCEENEIQYDFYVHY